MLRKPIIFVLIFFFLWVCSLSQEFFNAAWRGEIEVIKQEIEKNPKIVNEFNEHGYSAIMMAVIWGRKNQKEIINLLLNKKADINIGNQQGQTALHFAAQYASKDLVEYLISKGGDIGKKDIAGRIPLIYAILNKKKSNIIPLFKESRYVEITKDDKDLLLHNSAALGHTELVEIFLRKGADITSKRKDRGSFLHSAAEGGLPNLIGKGIKAGLDVNEPNLYKLSPLHLAVENDHFSVVKLLVERCADINCRDALGKTPYHLCKENKEIADYLKSNGALAQPFKYNVTGSYFGQKPPGMIPEIFAPGIVSTAKGFEFAGIFSPDGQEFFYTQRGLGFGQRIRYMKKTKNQWSEPNFSPFGYDCFEFEPGMSPDGEKIFYGSRRPLPGSETINPSADIWMVERSKNGWAKPKYLGSDMMYVTVTNAGDIYFTGKAKNSKMRGIVKKKLINGSYGVTIDLGENINFMPGTAHPFIAPDESYLIFDAQPNGPIEGPDLFISFKRTDGRWTKALRFPEEFDLGRDSAATVSPDGKYFFFASNGDIYWVDAKILEELKNKSIK
jgi:ankyrin repeat protein